MRTGYGSLTILAAATLAVAASGCQAVEPRAAADAPDAHGSAANLAIDTLAANLKIPREAIEVESVIDVDWRDSSLGCPKPGMAYLEVITSGHKVTLRANGQVYDVHEADNRAFVCALPSLAGVQPRPELVDGRLMLTAQRDLARRLGVLPRDIKPVGAEARTWDDASLDCPQAGVHYAQLDTDGWVLTLRHGGRDYTYHADAHRIIPCPDISAE
jgi:hypothetical protein